MGKTILIIEDDPTLRNLLKDNLVRAGYEVAVSGNGKEAFAIAASQHPVLILLDILLPDANGLELLKNIRSNVWGQNIEVVILSNLSDNQSVASALEQGSHDYLVKSDWEIEDILQLVREKIDN